MAPATPPPLPGSMTVPPWFQWEVVVAVVVVAVLLALVALALGGVRPGAAERAEWQAWLASRSVHDHPERTAPPGADRPHRPVPPTRAAGTR